MKATAALVAAYAGLALSISVAPRATNLNDFGKFFYLLLKSSAKEAPGVIEGVSTDNVIKITRGETPEIGELGAEVIKTYILRNPLGAVASEFEKPDNYVDGIPSNGGVIVPFIDKAICGPGERNFFTRILCGKQGAPVHIGSSKDGRGAKVCANSAGYCVENGLRTLCDGMTCQFKPGLPKVCFEAAKICVQNGEKVACGAKKCDFNREETVKGNAEVDKALKCRDISCWSTKNKVPSKFAQCATSRDKCGASQVSFSSMSVLNKLKYIADLEAAIAKCPEGSCWGQSTQFKEGSFVDCGAGREECKGFLPRSNHEVYKDLQKVLDADN